MIKNFVHHITSDMVTACDTESAANTAWENCPNADEVVTHGAMDAEHARLLVCVQADTEEQIREVEQAVLETCGVRHSKVADIARKLVERANTAELERALLRRKVRSLERRNEEIYHLLEVRTTTFNTTLAELRAELAASRSRSHRQADAA
ncbi:MULTISPECIES: hypothetical protein [Streptomyces]|uniref:hypothetical protein n=1 Tax=Streptomyces TaxID=1883 RepID=UPI00345C035E